MTSRAHRSSVAALLAIALGSCSTDQQSMFNPAGPGARALSALGGFVFILFGVIALGMFALIVFAAVKRRGTLAEHAPHDVGGGQGWLLWGGFVFPAVVLGVLFVMALRGMERFPLHDDGDHGADIRVVGRQWWWQVQYLGDNPTDLVTTANEIHIPTGQPVTIELQSRDVIHSFWVPRLHGKVDLIPGMVNHIRIQADEPGVYDGQCAEFCGAEHAKMRLLVVAETPEKYAEWIKHEAAHAAQPTEALAVKGQALFETKACALCHTVRGTHALGTVGPDLTHLASRRGLAANSLPNSHAYLAAWITRAQSLKPEAQMPNLTDFTGEELTAISAYLQQLK